MLNGAVKIDASVMPTVPLWVSSLVNAPNGETRNRVVDGVTLSATILTSPVAGLRLASVHAIDAALATAPGFENATAAAYELARDLLRDTDAPHPIRIWNFVPRIHDRMDDGLDRYKVFNRGRFSALSAWLRGPDHFEVNLPTATAVGHRAHDLLVHILSAPRAGRPVENPRQCPAFRYSTRHGPRPPCFARATVARIDGMDTLMIGGTASIRGEDSMFAGSLADQLDESFLNLASLVTASCEPEAGAHAPDDPLALIRSARVYYTRDSDRAQVVSTVLQRLTRAREIEWVRAGICRPELLVEIEGLASLPTGPDKGVA